MELKEIEKLKKEVMGIIPKLVKATVAAIIIKDNKILLEKRSHIIEKEKWCLPGGIVETGETAEAAIRRELKEELNLDAKDIKFLGYHDEIMPEIKNYSLVLIFSTNIGGEIKINKEESSEVKWYDKSSLNSLDFAYQHGEIITKYFLNKLK